MSAVDYSQSGEQTAILANTPECGCFLDIGAFHPKVFSNTRALYERGWSGVMVEPAPVQFMELLKEYKDEPRITLVQAAVDPRGGLVDFYLTNDAVSTTSTAWYEKWRAEARFHGRVVVAAVPLLDVLALGVYDFVSIDVEGQSADMLLALLQAPITLPRCICVEHDDRAAELAAAASAHGYRAALKNGCNLVLAREAA